MPRIAIVETEKCNPSGCGDFLCVRLCPINRQGNDCIVKAGKAAINEELCIGCDICVNRCPYNAIHIINLPKELEKPIHRYGKNGFSLYSLPSPIFGKVVGILGKNGIGKTTAIEILSGILKPNLGRESAEYKDLIEFFKGTETQSFFEKINKGEIKVAYKPQNVGIIQKAAKGKVRDLLNKIDEKNMLDEVAEKLDINLILDNDIREISGGELQRAAIAATVLKKANLYIFDEPTSYLDIKQRIKISRFIKELAKEDTAVLVVEHDLIILDYMTDLVHIMYGKENCYGIVSQPKSTRTAINVYLSGYLKEENIRFRDYEIKFLVKPPFKLRAEQPLTEWNDIEKKLGKFKLEAEKGEISKNDVIGILGENGIGKTTFVKILANVIKQDKGEIKENVNVSYKSQYLEINDSLVMDVLDNAIKKYPNLIVNPLDLKPLFDRKLNQLSGGQLQRVAIAHCLSQDVKLMLLDEPSAYLDVEQRLKVAKVINDVVEQRGISVLVVDHDLSFIDFLSKRLIVFKGKPALNGLLKGPFSMEEGMNLFLYDLNISMRRDIQSSRPRINKEGSVKDRLQKETGKLYYS